MRFVLIDTAGAIWNPEFLSRKEGTLRALLSIEPGGPETLVLGMLPEPVPESDELLVQVAACGLNYPDVLIIDDLYQMKPARPFAPGCEIAGTVRALGDDVRGFAVGDRVVATTRGRGGLAEQAIVRASNAFLLPREHDFVPAAALLITYGTAIHALVDRAHLRAGEQLVVLGAAGGVGLAAVQIGRILGAKIIAAVSSDEKAQAALAAGAHETIVYPPDIADSAGQRSFMEALKARTAPGGADVVVDPVGGPYTEPALRASAWGGRYLVIGFPAGIPRVPLNLPLLKGASIIGVFQGQFSEREAAANSRNIAQLFHWWGEGKLEPTVSQIYPLGHAGEALAVLAGRKGLGKLVVDLRGGRH